MNKNDILRDKTVDDFGDQWSRYTDSDGWWGSVDMLVDTLGPLIDIEDLKGATIVEIGSGAGRIVSMLLEAGAKHVYAIEPSLDAFQVLQENVRKMKRPTDVTVVNAYGHNFKIKETVDYAFAIGVIQFIPDPDPVLKAAYESLKPGGHLFLWVYSYEGNSLYVRIFGLVRKVTTRLPHVVLRFLIELLYIPLFIYRYVGKIIPLPLHDYIENVLWPMSPQKRRLVMYDQLNPTYAKYHKREEAIQLLEDSGFCNIRIFHRHGYSWSIIGQKPTTQQ